MVVALVVSVGAGVAPKVTVPPARLVPVIVTRVPPVVGPLFGTMLVIVGGSQPVGVVYWKSVLGVPVSTTLASAAERPPQVSTVTSTIEPAGMPEGAVARTNVPSPGSRIVAVMLPNRTVT